MQYIRPFSNDTTPRHLVIGSTFNFRVHLITWTWDVRSGKMRFRQLEATILFDRIGLGFYATIFLRLSEEDAKGYHMYILKSPTRC